MSSLGFGLPNFNVSNDRILDNLRVRSANTLKLPPASVTLIDPNFPAPPGTGNNDPATNDSLRSGVPQAGAIVYCTTPIVNPLPGPPVDGCFDNRNHLYFSDGNNWIPLANCLENNGDLVGPQYAEARVSQGKTTATDDDKWEVVSLFAANDVSTGFEVDLGDWRIYWRGANPIYVKVTVSASWSVDELGSPPGVDIRADLGVGFNGDDPSAYLTQEAALSDLADIGSPPTESPYPRNVTVSGIQKLSTDQYLDVRARNVTDTRKIRFEHLNFSVIKLS